MRRRRLNVRLLTWLVVGTALVGGGVHALQVHNTRKYLTGYLALADRAEKEGKPEKAREYLKRYLDFKANDDDVLVRYARLLDDLSETVPGALSATLQTYEKILERARDDSRYLDLRLRLARILVGDRRYRLAQPHLEILRAHAHDPSVPADGQWQELLAQCLESEQQYDEAAKLYEEAIRQAPGRIETYLRLALLLRQHGRSSVQEAESAAASKKPGSTVEKGAKPVAKTSAEPVIKKFVPDSQGADAVIDRMVAANRQSAQAYLARSRYRRQYGLPGADEDLARARKLGPDDPDVILAAAQAEMTRESGRLDEARKLLEHGLAKHPRKAALYQLLANLELRENHPKAAEECLTRGLREADDRQGVEWTLAHLLVQKGDAERAKKLVDDLSATAFPKPLLDYLKARLLVLQGDWAQAARALEQVRRLLEGASPELVSQVDLLLGQCYERLNDSERRLAALKSAAETNPKAVPTRLEWANALAAEGKFDEAIAAYRALISEFPAAWLPLARLLVLRNLQRPENQRHWEDAEKALTEAAQAVPGAEVELAVLQAQVLMGRQQAGEAQKILERVRDAHPDRVEPWLGLADLWLKQGQPDQALALLDEAEPRFQGQTEALVTLQLARISQWAQRGGEAARNAIAKLADDQKLQSLPPEPRARLLQGLAEAVGQLQDRASAGRLWTKLAEQKPQDLQPRLVLLDLAIQSRDEAALQRAIENLRKVEGEDGVYWRFGDALHWIAQAGSPATAGAGGAKPLQAARARLEEIAKRRPGWSRVPLLEAEIAVKEGRPDQAIASYQKALALGEQGPEVVRRLVQLLFERRRFAEADQALRKLQAQGPLSGDLQRLAAEIALQSGDPERALKLASEAVPADANNVSDLLWLGRIYAAAQRSTEAEAAFRRATTLESGAKVPDTWIALVQHLARSGRTDQAKQEIENARKQLPPKRAAWATAICHELVEQEAEASQQFQAALRDQPDNAGLLHDAADFYLRSNQFTKAEPLLRRLTDDPKTQASAEMVAWARRGLASALAAEGKFDEAMDVFKQIARREGRPGPEDQRTQALILAARPEPEHRLLALDLLEKLRQAQALGTDDELVLARLYETVPDLPSKTWPKARQILFDLVVRDAQPRYLAAFVNGLLQHEEAPTGIEPWLAKLEALAPPDQNFETLSLRARLLQAEGRDDEAVRRLQNFATQNPEQAEAVAGLLEAMNLPAAAEQVVGQLKAKKPEDELAIAEFLARLGHPERALDLCDKLWEAQTCPPEQVADAYATILDTAKDPRLCTRVREKLAPALQNDPSNPRLLVAQAVLLSTEGHPDEAVKVYRALLRSNDSDLVALNNLAWLLALEDQPAPAAEALDLINRAIRLAGPMPPLLDTRAVARLATHRPDEAERAVQDLETALRQSRTAPFAFHLARAYLATKTKQRDQALATFKKAEKLGLKATLLDPAERPIYQQLRSELLGLR
jgi:tetratricopeptide (TPR) repeat protein